MKMHVYGPCGQDCPTALIIHPMPSSASSMKAALCDHMGPGLRFLVPDLSAHGDEASAPYVSAAAEAAAIHEWLTSHEVRCLSLGFGASLGGVFLFELLRFPDLSFDRLFIEGVSFYSGGPVARVGGAVLSRVMVAKHRKAVRDPEAGARKLARLYGEASLRGDTTRPRHGGALVLLLPVGKNGDYVGDAPSHEAVAGLAIVHPRRTPGTRPG